MRYKSFIQKTRSQEALSSFTELKSLERLVQTSHAIISR